MFLIGANKGFYEKGTVEGYFLMNFNVGRLVYVNMW